MKARRQSYLAGVEMARHCLFFRCYHSDAPIRLQAYVTRLDYKSRVVLVQDGRRYILTLPISPAPGIVLALLTHPVTPDRGLEGFKCGINGLLTGISAVLYPWSWRIQS